MIMGNHQPPDLLIRTKVFAKQVREFVSLLPKAVLYSDDVKQVIRSSGSIAANYIEAQEAMSRKEAKETILWLELIEAPTIKENQIDLIREANELAAIFTSIAKKLDTASV